MKAAYSLKKMLEKIFVYKEPCWTMLLHQGDDVRRKHVGGG